MKPRPPSTSAPAPTLGVSAHEVIPLDELRRRLRWGHRSVAEAQRRGLRLVRFGKLKYALGSDVLAFFSDLASQAAEKERR